MPFKFKDITERPSIISEITALIFNVFAVTATLIEMSSYLCFYIEHVIVINCISIVY